MYLRFSYSRITYLFPPTPQSFIHAIEMDNICLVDYFLLCVSICPELISRLLPREILLTLALTTDLPVGAVQTRSLANGSVSASVYCVTSHVPSPRFVNL